MTDRLSINQLRKLQRIAPEDGESAVPLSTSEALDRLRRVERRGQRGGQAPRTHADGDEVGGLDDHGLVLGVHDESKDGEEVLDGGSSFGKYGSV